MARRRGHVYVLWAEGTDRFKIGFTACGVDGPQSRLTRIEEQSPVNMRVIGTRRATRDDETRLHRMFNRYLVKGREWFALPESELLWLMEEYLDNGTTPLRQVAL